MIGLVRQMSGKRKIIIEEGTSRDHRYDRYLYWKKEIFDENTGEGVKYTPTFLYNRVLLCYATKASLSFACASKQTVTN